MAYDWPRLTAELDQATSRIRSAQVIAHAIVTARKPTMPRDFASLDKALGQFHSDLDHAAEKVFDRLDAVNVRAADVFKKTNAHIDAKAQSVEQVDALLTTIEQSNGGPSSDGSPQDSASSSATAEKKT